MIGIEMLAIDEYIEVLFTEIKLGDYLRFGWELLSRFGSRRFGLIGLGPILRLT